MTALLLALIVLPAVAGAALAVAGRRADRVAPVAGAVVAAAVLALALAAALAPPGAASAAPSSSASGGVLAVAVGPSPVPMVLLPVVAGVALLVLVFAAAARTADAARFTGLMLLFVAAVDTTLAASTLPLLLAGWEGMGAVSWALIGHDRSTTAVDAGLTAFITTRSADLGLYLATGAAVAAGIGTSLAALPGAPRPWLDVIAAGVVVAALGKAAQLPFSFWLSRAMVGPSPVSALLHAAAMVAMGGALLLRLQPLLAATGWAGPVVAWAGALTTVVLGIVALAQRELKQLLAASTVAQLGVVVLAAGVGATAAGTLQLVAHAAAKALLFLAAGMWPADGTGRLDRLAGVGRRSVATGLAATFAAFALSGLPPSPLGAAGDAVLAAALRQDPALLVAALAGSAVSAAYSARLVLTIWRPPLFTDQARFDDTPLGSAAGRRVAEIGLIRAGGQVGVLGVLAAALVGLAVVAPRPAGQPALALGAAVAGLAGVAFALVRRGRPLRRGRRWFRLEPVALAGVVRPVQRSAAALARFDDVLAAGVEAAARAVGTGATAVARFDAALARAVDGSARPPAARRAPGVAAGVQAAAALVRRTQSGSLQTYYLAGVAAVAVLVVVAVAVR